MNRQVSTTRCLFHAALTKLFFGFFLSTALASAATVNVPTGADPVANGVAFQTALNNAQCGDTIVLKAGATYQGPRLADQAFLLPYKAGCVGADYISIVTSNLAGLSADGVRIDPAAHVAAMPRLVADTSSFGMPVVAAQLYAHHYKLVGLEITNTGVLYAPNLVSIRPVRGSTTEYPTYNETIGTHDFILDRCFIHPAEVSGNNLFPSTETRTAGRGVNVEGVNVSIINSYIAGLAGKFPAGSSEAGSNIDSYGVYSVVGPGPFQIVNNYIEAQFNNVFIGGGDNHTPNSATVTNPTLNSATLSNVSNLGIGDLVAFSSAASTPKPWETGKITAIDGNNVSFTLMRGSYATPSIPPDAGGTARWNGVAIHNVEIRRNTLNKPDVWNAFSNPKAFIEIKDCVDCVIDGNYMYSGIGTTVAFTPRNQNGSAPWARIENLTYTNNIVIGYKWGVGSQGSDNEQPSVPSGNWTIRNNVWYTPKPISGAADFFLQLGQGLLGGHDIFVTHNTILQPAHIAEASAVTNGQFVFKDNIVSNGEYGIHCYVSTSNLKACLPGLQMTGNVIVGPPMAYRPYCTNQGDAVYPPGNSCVDSATRVGFADLANNNYRLAPTSPFKGKATDGTDPGVDMDALLAAQSGAAKAATITEPYNGANVTGDMTASAEVPSSISNPRVEFFFEGQLAGTATVTPYSVVVDTRTVKNGTRSLMAKVFDASGYVGSSSLVSVIVNNPDTQPPTATITSPSSGTTVSGTVMISASASDNESVTTVEFLVDSDPRAASVSGAPFQATIDTKALPDGVHAIVAKAYDAAGHTGYSAPISVTVANVDTAPPATIITSPSGGVTASGTISVAAAASDNVGVTRVEFLVDDVVSTVSTASPYTKTLDTTRLSNGPHSIAARAYDVAGNSGTSARVSISVNNVQKETTSPIVTIAAATDSKGAVTASASATDNVGVTRVEFYVDGKLNTSDNTAPYTASFRLNGSPGSRHSVFARAYDAAGNVGTSSSVTLSKR